MINSVPPRVTRSRRLPLDRYVNLLFTNYKKNDDHWIACWMSKNDGCVDSLQLEEVKTTLCKRGGASCVPSGLPLSIQLLHLDQTRIPMFRRAALGWIRGLRDFQTTHGPIF